MSLLLTNQGQTNLMARRHIQKDMAAKDWKHTKPHKPNDKGHIARPVSKDAIAEVIEVFEEVEIEMVEIEMVEVVEPVKAVKPPKPPKQKKKSGTKKKKRKFLLGGD